MKPFVIVGSLIAAMLLLTGRDLQAMSFGPLVDAIHEQRLHPGPEADAKVRKAQLQAEVFELVWYGTPVILVVYLIVRMIPKRYWRC